MDLLLFFCLTFNRLTSASPPYDNSSHYQFYVIGLLVASPHKHYLLLANWLRLMLK